MIKEKNILFLCEGLNHANFQFNMEESFRKLGYNCIYLVTNLAAYLALKKMTKNMVVLVKRKKCPYYSDVVLKSKEYIEKSLSKENVISIYKAVYYFCSKINSKYSIDLFICSQGVKAAEITVREYARKNNIKTLFFELSNLPGKTFFDIEGSNTSSYLYNNIEILDKSYIDDITYEQWREKYLENKFKEHIVKQAVNLRQFNLSLKYVFVTRFDFLYTGIKTKKLDIFDKVKDLFMSKYLNIEYDNLDFEKEKYIFFPMQVSTDSQIVLNSDIGLMDSLSYSLKEAQRLGVILVVKLHPAEKSVEITKSLLMLRKKMGFKIVNDNTFVIIKNSLKVITINSTVALESMIIGKEVDILGRSYYKYFNKARIKSYIMNYLIDIDFFQNKSFSVEQIQRLLTRAKLL